MKRVASVDARSENAVSSDAVPVTSVMCAVGEQVLALDLEPTAIRELLLQVTGAAVALRNRRRVELASVAPEMVPEQ